MTSSVMAPDAREQRPGMAGRIFAFMPLWVFVIACVFSPTFIDSLGVMPPAALGLPVPLVVEATALIWMLIGAVPILRARSGLLEVLALTAFTIPATVVVVITPEVMAILRNLG